jgi:hypothetical protein
LLELELELNPKLANFGKYLLSYSSQFLLLKYAPS